jgi:flagellar basal body-associated protein FliL
MKTEQMVKEEEKMKNGMKKSTILRRTLFVVLMIVTVISMVLVSVDYAKYEAYKQEFVKEHPELEPWIDFKPYFAYNRLAYISVLAISLAWIGYVAFAIRKVRTHVA